MIKTSFSIIYFACIFSTALLIGCPSKTPNTPASPTATPTPTSTFTPTPTLTSTPTRICTVTGPPPASIALGSLYMNCSSAYPLGTISTGQTVAVTGPNLPGFWGDFFIFTAGSNSTYTIYLDCFSSVDGNPGNFAVFFAHNACGGGSTFPSLDSPVLQYTTGTLTAGEVYEINPYSASVTGRYRLTVSCP